MYVNGPHADNKKNFNSLSFLIKMKLSQSECIKLGIGIERVLSDLITYKTPYKNIKGKNVKGCKEKDHLFCDEQTKTIYYAELKANIMLDTEKTKSTFKKCLKIVENLKIEYPGYEIKWCLLAYRYLSYDEIPKVIQKKYNEIKDNLFGINQYLEMLSINFKFTHKQYVTFLNDIAGAMFGV